MLLLSLNKLASVFWSLHKLGAGLSQTLLSYNFIQYFYSVLVKYCNIVMLACVCEDGTSYAFAVFLSTQDLLVRADQTKMGEQIKLNGRRRHYSYHRHGPWIRHSRGRGHGGHHPGHGADGKAHRQVKN